MKRNQARPYLLLLSVDTLQENFYFEPPTNSVESTVHTCSKEHSNSHKRRQRQHTKQFLLQRNLPYTVKSKKYASPNHHLIISTSTTPPPASSLSPTIWVSQVQAPQALSSGTIFPDPFLKYPGFSKLKCFHFLHLLFFFLFYQSISQSFLKADMIRS